MATTDSVHRIIHARAFRHARCYAPDLVMTVLREVVAAPQLALLVDVDTLERSALAKIDRVMLLALDALARTSVQVVLVALYERERAALLQRSIAGSWCLTPGVGSTVAHVRRRIPAIPLIAISDEPDLLGALTSDDRGIALGRPGARAVERCRHRGYGGARDLMVVARRAGPLDIVVTVYTHMTAGQAKAESLAVLIINGPEPVAQRLASFLTRQGMRVTSVAGHAVGELEARARAYDCIMLDIGNQADAVALTRSLRIQNEAPILLVGSKADAATRVDALEAGADDCIAASLSERELLARVRALARRAQRRR